MKYFWLLPILVILGCDAGGLLIVTHRCAGDGGAGGELEDGDCLGGGGGVPW